MLTDYANKQSLIRPTWRDRLREAIADLRYLSRAMQSDGADDCHDPDLEVKRIRAINTLGDRWVGKPDSPFVYKRVTFPE